LIKQKLPSCWVLKNSYQHFMSIKVAINGFGRIGRPTFRRIMDNHSNLEVVAINDLTKSSVLAHLLKYDSLYGTYKKEVKVEKEALVVSGKKVRVFSEKDPEKLPWKELGVDILLECTGIFRDYEGAKKHLAAGAKRVIISAPSKDPARIPSFILGVNEEKFNSGRDLICDMASCTTNCLAPLVKVLNENFKVTKGFMTTVHSYTNDQKILDLPHKDLRRARAASLNIIPTTTGAAKSIGNVIPELEGKLDGIALRVPTPTVSVLDLICQVEKKTSTEEVNKTFQKASEKELKGILRAEGNPLVSSDFIGDSFSAIVDSSLTMSKDDLVKVVAWYDNEWGYACRLAEFAEYAGKKL
jgi:glyceraldehyde 3-phosphate dehydrogenase